IRWTGGTLGWLIAQTVLASGPTLAEGKKPGWHTVTILTGNYAGIPQELLFTARREAERILSDAQVKIDWVEAMSPCRNVAESQTDLPVCPQPSLTIKLLSRAMGARLHRPAKEFGLATGTTGYIFWDRIEGLKRGAISRSQLLAHVLAHEIGHILLGRGAHAPNGLMQPNWDSTNLVRAGQGGFRFTPQQIERLRDVPVNKSLRPGVIAIIPLRPKPEPGINPDLHPATSRSLHRTPTPLPAATPST
ncbi:MAG: hypothetical protein WKF37_11355, partial [Bryobacteraceae bacterium]